MASAIFGLASCSEILGVNNDPAGPVCDAGAKRCDGAVRQTCGQSYDWEDIDGGECADRTPVCTEDRCLGVRSVAAGDAHTCAILSDDTVRCWGRNNTGQLGDGTTVNRSIPVKVKNLSNVSSLALGGGDDDGFTCAVHDGGKVACWGRNALKMLGTTSTEVCKSKDKETPCSTTPLDVPDLKDIVSVSASVENACALDKKGDVFCWGLFVEVKQQTNIKNVLEIAVGSLHTCARTAKDVLCWGGNTFGQCGVDPSVTLSVNTPMPVAGLVGVTRIAAGYFHTCALTKDGDAVCWGSNQCGQLGDGTYCGTNCGTKETTCGQWQPTAVKKSDLLEPLSRPPRALGLGAFHTCVMSDRIFCWGRNDFGQVSITSGSMLGIGEPFVPTPVPSPVLHTLSLAVGPYHACARIEGGGVRCMGRNDYGQLGNGTTDSGPAVDVLWQRGR